ncbi:TPA: hypothetical protein ACPSKY_001000 [Legionella bozemanae]
MFESLFKSGNYFPNELNAQNGVEFVQFALQQIEQNGCYDPDKMGHDLFECIQLLMLGSLPPIR